MQRGQIEIKKVLTTLRALIHLKAAQMVVDDGMDNNTAKQFIAEKASLKNWRTLMCYINNQIAKSSIKKHTLDRLCKAIDTDYNELIRKAGIK